MKKLLAFAFIVVFALTVQADWKTWLHSGPPKFTPGPPDARAAIVSFAAGVPPDKRIMDFMLAFSEALRVHEGSALKPRLSEKYAVSDLPPGHNAVDLLMMTIVRAKAPNEMIIMAVQPESDARVAIVEFRSHDRPPKTHTFRFDSAGELLNGDFFTLPRHGFFPTRRSR